MPKNRKYDEGTFVQGRKRRQRSFQRRQPFGDLVVFQAGREIVEQSINVGTFQLRLRHSKSPADLWLGKFVHLGFEIEKTGEETWVLEVYVLRQKNICCQERNFLVKAILVHAFASLKISPISRY